MKTAALLALSALAAGKDAVLPPEGSKSEQVIMSLKKTFPARFGSFSYQFYSSCSYRFYNTVSVEDSNSQPLKKGMRGMFVQHLDTGVLDGWLMTAKENDPWVFKSIKLSGDEFDPEVAPNLDEEETNGNAWTCSKKRVVFDDIYCSRSVTDAPEIKPGAKVRFWGYRSDGQTHSWEASQSTTSLEGPAFKQDGHDCVHTGPKDVPTNPVVNGGHHTTGGGHAKAPAPSGEMDGECGWAAANRLFVTSWFNIFTALAFQVTYIQYAINQTGTTFLVVANLVMTIFHQIMWFVIFVAWFFLYDTDNIHRNIKTFVDVAEVIKYMTVYSGYWIMAILVLFSTAILPTLEQNTDFNSIYDSSHHESENIVWIGWFLFAWYVMIMMSDIYIQLGYDDCLSKWRNWAAAQVYQPTKKVVVPVHPGKHDDQPEAGW